MVHEKQKTKKQKTKKKQREKKMKYDKEGDQKMTQMVWLLNKVEWKQWMRKMNMKPTADLRRCEVESVSARWNANREPLEVQKECLFPCHQAILYLTKEARK